MVDSAVDVEDERTIRVFILDDHELVRRASPICSVPRTIRRSSGKPRTPARPCSQSSWPEPPGTCSSKSAESWS
jgi:hypothetical protein